MSGLPRSWAATTVGAISRTIRYGYTASASTEPVGPRMLRITDIQDGQVGWNRVPYCKIDPADVVDYLLEEGDLVFARTGGTVGKSFLIRGIPERAVFASYLIKLTAADGIVPGFLYWFFQSLSYWEQIGLKKGGLQGNVNATTLSGLELPIPPTREQHRIVAKIEELFSEVDKAAESLTLARTQLRAYRQALLKEAFEGKLTADWRAANPDMLEPPETLLPRIRAQREARYRRDVEDWQTALAVFRAGGALGERPPKPKGLESIAPQDFGAVSEPNVPADWERCFLGELDIDVFDGPFGSHLKTSDYVDRGIRVVRLENIGFGQFIDEKQSFVSEEKYKTIKRHTVRAGDIVFSSFVTDAIRSTIVPETVPIAINKADCFAVRTFGTRFRAKFLQYFLECRNAFKQVEGMIHGVGRPRINTTQLKEISVPLCDPKEQDEIIDRLERDLSELEMFDLGARDQLSRMVALRQSILKQAFSGQLVEQDPTDEPASALIARLREASPLNRTRRRKSS